MRGWGSCGERATRSSPTKVMSTAQLSTDLENYVLDEVFYTQISDPDSKLSSYLSTLAVKFILENLGLKKGREFLRIFRRDPTLAFSFASKNIEDFNEKLADYLRKHVAEVGEYLVSQ